MEDPSATKIEPPKNIEIGIPENEESIENPKNFTSTENKKDIKTGKKLNVITDE